MCFPSAPTPPASATPAPPPAPAAPNPIPQDIGGARKAANVADGGNADGSANTRVDRTLDIPGSAGPAGGSGLNM